LVCTWDCIKIYWNSTTFCIKIPSKFVRLFLFWVFNHYFFFRIVSTQIIESKCKLNLQTYWINTNIVLNYLELKMNQCYFSINNWFETIQLNQESSIESSKKINLMENHSGLYSLRPQYCFSLETGKSWTTQTIFRIFFSKPFTLFNIGVRCCVQKSVNLKVLYQQRKSINLLNTTTN
jgi:hypothetical protein